MTFSPQTEQLLQLFIMLASVLMIPLVVGLMVVLFKLAFLIHSAQDFLAFASSELSPMMVELRTMVNQVGEVGQRATNRVQDLRGSLHQTGPLLKEGIQRTQEGVGALFAGIARSFRAPR